MPIVANTLGKSSIIGDWIRINFSLHLFQNTCPLRCVGYSFYNDKKTL